MLHQQVLSCSQSVVSIRVSVDVDGELIVLPAEVVVSESTDQQ